MTDKDEVYEIDLLKIAKLLFSRAFLIIIITVLCAGLALTCALELAVPQYTASVLMYVNNSSFSIGGTSVNFSSGDISAAKSLVSTYCTILTTRLTLEEVIDQANLNYTYEELKNAITAGAVNDTEIFKISVETPDAELSCKIANTIAKVLPQKISAVVDGASVRVVDLAVTPRTMSSPSYKKITLIGGVIGFIITCAWLVIGNLVNERVDTEDWLRDKYGEKYPLLAVIPDEVAVSEENERYGKYGKYGKYSRYSRYYKHYYGHYNSYTKYAYYAQPADETDKTEKTEKGDK